MKQKKLFQFILFFTLTLGGLFSAHCFAQAATGTGVDVFVDGILLDNGKPIFEETNWTPGDSVTKTVELKNLTDKSFNVDLVITEQPSGILAEKLKITIADLGNVLIYGPKTLKEFFGDSPMAFPDIGPNATNTYKFKIEFLPATNPEDNLYNYNDKNKHSYEKGERCNTIFDLNFGFTEITTPPPGQPRGDGPQWFWQGGNGGVVAGITNILPKLPARLPRVGAWSALILASAGLVWTTAIYLRKKK